MFYYIDQPLTPSFPFGLVKTKSGFIVRSVETGSGRWTLVVAVISVDAYTFLAFGFFEASLSSGINTRILVPCLKWKCVPTTISGGVDISEVPGCYLLQQMSSQGGSQNFLQRLVVHELTVYLSIFNLFLTQWNIAILSNQITLNHTTL